MPLFDRDSWWSGVFIFRGGVIGLIWKGFIGYLSYTSSLYAVCRYMGNSTMLSDEGRSIHFLGGFVSFLLIWRLNQCYTRYESGKEFTSVYFSHLASLMGVGCGYIKGADLNSLPATQGANKALRAEELEMSEHLGITMKVHLVRLTIAISVAFKYHCRIAENSDSGEPLNEEQLPGILFDLLRLKGLLYPEEHGLIDSASGLYMEQDRGQEKIFANNRRSIAPGKRNSDGSNGKLPSFDPIDSADQKPCPIPVILLQMLRDVIAQPISQRWGYPERVLNVIEVHICQIALAFEQLDRLITIPLPLAYLQHCKLLFLVFIVIYPLEVDTNLGLWANIVSPCLLFLALLGFEVLADEMENPIGDDDLDLNIMRMIHDLENRGGQIFEIAQTSRVKNRTALLAPIEDIDPEFSAYDQGRWKGLTHDAYKALKETGGFDFHFSWVPFPPHILAFCGEKERGIAQAELLRMSFDFEEKSEEKASCCSSSCCCSCCIGAADEPNSSRPLLRTAVAERPSVVDHQPTYLGNEAAEPHLITHFLCVSRQREITQNACMQMVIDFFKKTAATPKGDQQQHPPGKRRVSITSRGIMAVAEEE